MKQSLLITCLWVFGLSVFAQRPDYLQKDSIQSALDGNMRVDRKKIYVVGYSGSGYATFFQI